jgi:hypothetical protein
LGRAGFWVPQRPLAPAAARRGRPRPPGLPPDAAPPPSHRQAAIEATRALPFGPGEDVTFIANDWHTSLLPILLKVGPRGAGRQQRGGQRRLCTCSLHLQPLHPPPHTI